MNAREFAHGLRVLGAFLDWSAFAMAFPTSAPARMVWDRSDDGGMLVWLAARLSEWDTSLVQLVSRACAACGRVRIIRSREVDADVLAAIDTLEQADHRTLLPLLDRIRAKSPDGLHDDESRALQAASCALYLAANVAGICSDPGRASSVVSIVAGAPCAPAAAEVRRVIPWESIAGPLRTASLRTCRCGAPWCRVWFDLAKRREAGSMVARMVSDRLVTEAWAVDTDKDHRGALTRSDEIRHAGPSVHMIRTEETLYEGVPSILYQYEAAAPVARPWE